MNAKQYQQKIIRNFIEEGVEITPADERSLLACYASAARPDDDLTFSNILSMRLHIAKIAREVNRAVVCNRILDDDDLGFDGIEEYAEDILV